MKVGNDAGPLYETIYAKYNPNVDLRLNFLSTGPVTIAPNTNPVFTNGSNKLEQELIKGYRSKSFTAAVPEYVGWTLLPKLSVEEKNQVSFQMTRPQKYIPIKAGVGVEVQATVGLGIQSTTT